MPSEKILQQKKQFVAELVEKLKNAQSGVLVDYRGLTVEQDTVLRRNLREGNVEYRVIKNNLLNLAIAEPGLSELEPLLEGPTALAISNDDLVAPARILNEFAEKNKKMEIKGGFVEGGVISVQEVKALANLPSKEQLVASVLRGFNAPLSGFANVLIGNVRGLAVCLSKIAEQKESA